MQIQNNSRLLGLIPVTSIILLAVIVFCILQPSIKSFVLPRYRSFLVHSWLTQVRAHSHIESQYFWEMRERFTPGTFEYAHNGLPHSVVQHFQKDFAENGIADNNALPFLTFTSNYSKSIEILVPEYWTLETLHVKKNTEQVLFSSATEKITLDPSHNLHVIFLKPLEEMKTANGFFDYAGHDKEFVAHKKWLVIAEFQLDPSFDSTFAPTQ